METLQLPEKQKSSCCKSPKLLHVKISLVEIAYFKSCNSNYQEEDKGNKTMPGRRGKDMLMPHRTGNWARVRLPGSPFCGLLNKPQSFRRPQCAQFYWVFIWTKCNKIWKILNIHNYKECRTYEILWSRFLDFCAIHHFMPWSAA